MNVMDWIAVGVSLLVLAGWSIADKLGKLIELAGEIAEKLDAFQVEAETLNATVTSVEAEIIDRRSGGPSEPLIQL